MRIWWEFLEPLTNVLGDLDSIEQRGESHVRLVFDPLDMSSMRSNFLLMM